MAKRIAVEEGLSNVVQALKAEGFEVTRITSGTMNHVDACVVTGLSSNMMGIHDTQGNRMPVIQAEGMTADEVVRQLNDRLHAVEAARGVE
jgi:hypothetical protein